MLAIVSQWFSFLIIFLLTFVIVFFFLNHNLLSFVVNNMVDMYTTVKNSNGPANYGATHPLSVMRSITRSGDPA